MSPTSDCGGGLSREHYISEAILKQLGTIRGSGFPGRLDELSEIPINALVVKVLCKRHNSMLSQLDTPAGWAFQRIEETRHHLLNPSLNRRKERHFLVDGYALELWALKTLFAAHVGGIARSEGNRTLGNLRFQIEKALTHLIAGRLKPPLGIYFHNAKRPTKVGVSFGILRKDGNIFGIRIQLLQLGFDCIFDDINISPELLYRPSACVYWNKEGFTGVLHFSWKKLTDGQDFYMEELG